MRGSSVSGTSISRSSFPRAPGSRSIGPEGFRTLRWPACSSVVLNSRASCVSARAIPTPSSSSESPSLAAVARSERQAMSSSSSTTAPISPIAMGTLPRFVTITDLRIGTPGRFSITSWLGATSTSTDSTTWTTRSRSRLATRSERRYSPAGSPGRSRANGHRPGLLGMEHRRRHAMRRRPQAHLAVGIDDRELTQDGSALASIAKRQHAAQRSRRSRQDDRHAFVEIDEVVLGRLRDQAAGSYSATNRRPWRCVPPTMVRRREAARCRPPPASPASSTCGRDSSPANTSSE